jgi:TonB family protein
VRSTVKNLNPVRIMALVTETGKVSETKVLQSSGNSFVDEAAASAVKNTKFEAPTKNGVPVKMWFTLPPVKVQ